MDDVRNDQSLRRPKRVRKYSGPVMWRVCCSDGILGSSTLCCSATFLFSQRDDDGSHLILHTLGRTSHKSPTDAQVLTISLVWGHRKLHPAIAHGSSAEELCVCSTDLAGSAISAISAVSADDDGSAFLDCWTGDSDGSAAAAAAAGLATGFGFGFGFGFLLKKSIADICLIGPRGAAGFDFLASISSIIFTFHFS